MDVDTLSHIDGILSVVFVIPVQLIGLIVVMVGFGLLWVIAVGVRWLTGRTLVELFTGKKRSE